MRVPLRCSTSTLASVLLVIAALAASASPAPQAPSPAPGVHPVSGRRIAQVMSHTAADWLDRPERVMEEQPERALGVIGVKRGQIVADVGAGSGYYTVRLARRVAPGGIVYATDIQPEMLALLDKRLKRERVAGVVPVLATLDDPRLPDAALDLILMVDVYHELSRPQQMLRQLKRALKPDGRLVLIEFRKEDPSVPIRFEHKMSVAEAELELEAEGFRLARVSDVLPWQHVLIFDTAAVQ
jgi:ubiquinone/menaquinone biosynthesis C-methylase UbiE